MASIQGGSSVVIESRLHLFSALAEAAETEHNLMCLYIFATLSLKKSISEGLTAEELAAVESWRRIIMGISLEEMTHLCLVSNLFSAIGGTSHFMRPNFPVSPGLYPADFILELAPFSMDTIEHFIYLERPMVYDMKDADAFRPQSYYERVPPQNRIMPNPGDYKTVGVLYTAIREALIGLAKELGEKNLFCGNPARQVSISDVSLPGLIEIHNLETALKAIDTIVTQGEGATAESDSHFERFSKIKTEYINLLKTNPKFNPSRAVVRNPLMRKPAVVQNRVWINHPLSSRLLDLANAVYLFTLRVLTQVYAYERESNEKKEFLSMSLGLMHIMAVMGETLTFMPVSENADNRFAGISFAMARTLQTLAKENELDLMLEGVQRFDFRLKEFQSDMDLFKASSTALISCLDRLFQVQSQIGDLISRIKVLQQERQKNNQTKKIDVQEVVKSKNIHMKKENDNVKVCDGKTISVGFEGKKCIHTRHCVTELPQVFKANVPGEWIAPDEASAEILAAVIRECPSGALTYKSKGTFPEESVPPINVMRVYENGPYAFLADLEVDGSTAGYRATLCRCGQSKNKPYCDHSHVESKFVATGEPSTINDKALANRTGPLKIKRIKDGPLSVSGNVEVCAATGRTVLRTNGVNLCRCGHSKNKPVCDGSHIMAGFKDTITLDATPT